MTIDARDIRPIAATAATAAKVLEDRGKRAWDRAGEFDSSGVRSVSYDRTGASGRRTELYVDGPDGARQLSADEVADGASSDWHSPAIHDPAGDQATNGSRDPQHRTELRDALKALDVAASRVVDLVDQLTRTKATIKPEDPRGWCPNCRTAGVMEPSALRSDGSQRYRDRDGRCRPCIEFVGVHGFDRPALIIARKSEGRKLSQSEADRAIDRARREHEIEQRKATKRVELHRRQRAQDPQMVRCPSTMTRDGVELRCELQVRDGIHPGNHMAEQDGTVQRWPNRTEGAA